MDGFATQAASQMFLGTPIEAHFDKEQDQAVTLW
jgi:hypothetical protein